MELHEVINEYTYNVNFDAEDRVYIAHCKEMKSITAHGETPEKALAEIRLAVKAALKWLE